MIYLNNYKFVFLIGPPVNPWIIACSLPVLYIRFTVDARQLPPTLNKKIVNCVQFD